MKTKSIIMLLIAVPVLVFSEDQPFDTYTLSDSFRYSPSVVDARSIAMGRTSIVSAVGSNSMFSNPGILATLDERQFQVGGRMVMGTMDRSNRVGKTSAVANFNIKPHLYLNHISVSTPYLLEGSNVKLAIGIGYRTYFDYGGSSEVDKLKLNGKSQDGVLVMSVKGNLDVITPTIAVNLQDRYFVGVTFNTNNKSIFGSIESKRKARPSRLEGAKSYPKMETTLTEVEHSASFWHYGGLIKVDDKLSIGFSFTPEFEWEWDEIKVTKSIGVSLRDKEVSMGGGFDVLIPSVKGVGVTYQLAPRLLIAGEYQDRKFSDIEFNAENYYDYMDNGACYRVGFEYKGPVLLRIGLFSDAVLPSIETNDNDPEYLTGLTGGISYGLGMVSLDGFAEYSSYDQKVVEPDFRDKRGINMFKFALSASYKF